MKDIPSNIYAKAMENSERSRGFALWEPQTPNNRPVNLGDIGYIYEGRYYFLFNITSSDSAINPFLPDIFNYDHDGLYSSSILAEQEFRSSKSVKVHWDADAEVKGGLPAPPLGFRFSFDQSEEQAAVLLTGSNPCMSEWRREYLWKWALDNNRWTTWREAVKTHANPIHQPNHDRIFLVYGETRTSSWHITVSESESREGESSVHVCLESVAQIGGGRRVRTEQSPLHATNWGPQHRFAYNSPPLTAAEIPTIPSVHFGSGRPAQPASRVPISSHLDAPVPSSTLAGPENENINQTIFLKRITYYDWDRRALPERFMGAIHSAYTGMKSGLPDFLKPKTSPGSSPSKGKGPQARNSGGEYVEDPNEVIQYDPLDVLALYLFEYGSPNTKGGAVADDDVSSLFALYTRFTNVEDRPSLYDVLRKLKPPVVIVNDVAMLGLEIDENPLRWRVTQELPPEINTYTAEEGLQYDTLLNKDSDMEEDSQQSLSASFSPGETLVNATPVQVALSAGRSTAMERLLENEADPNLQYNTELQDASSGGHVDIVKLLLEKGADVNGPGGLHGTALQAASSGGHVDIMKLLLEKGANVNTQEGEYGNALQAASSCGNFDIVKLLLEKGADVNTLGGLHGTALQAASFGGHVNIVKLLLEKGADVNGLEGLYGTALQAASACGHVNIVKLLLEKGAGVNLQGGKCGNALQAASACGHVGIVKLLLEKGAEVNARGGVYETALQAASSGGHVDIMKLLLEKGADPQWNAVRQYLHFGL